MDSGFVFCDFLTVTFPAGDSIGVMDEVCPLLDGSGFEDKGDGAFCCPITDGWVTASVKYGVFRIQVTGGALSAFRRVDLFQHLLCAFGSFPHRVTRLDATLDLPWDSPPFLAALYASAVSGSVSLSRKRLRGQQVTRVMHPSVFDGRDTGSVYLGKRTAEVSHVAYDKREEIFSRTGVDVGPLLRNELRLSSKMGVSLRDAWEPAPVFWHFVAPAILAAPGGVSEWVSGQGLGFAVDRASLLPYERLRRRVESSSDLASMVRLARSCGPEGYRLMESLIRRLYDAALDIA